MKSVTHCKDGWFQFSLHSPTGRGGERGGGRGTLSFPGGEGEEEEEEEERRNKIYDVFVKITKEKNINLYAAKVKKSMLLYTTTRAA